ncbi:MAG: DUF3795 domain-containing protein [Clostridia bacterium]|nr:DUF3795 domain-containing protein [Clostridia bacterium]
MKEAESNFNIAPCGMNCSLCIGYQRSKKPCSGCNQGNLNKPVHCVDCVIKNCEHIKENDIKFCYTCENFPCRRLKNLDQRYRHKYGMSMLANQEAIKAFGLEQFIRNEQEKWTCASCGKLLSVHREVCQHCGSENRYYGTYE